MNALNFKVDHAWLSNILMLRRKRGSFHWVDWQERQWVSTYWISPHLLKVYRATDFLSARNWISTSPGGHLWSPSLTQLQNLLLLLVAASSYLSTAALVQELIEIFRCHRTRHSSSWQYLLPMSRSAVCMYHNWMQCIDGMACYLALLLWCPHQPCDLSGTLH